MLVLIEYAVGVPLLLAGFVWVFGAAWPWAAVALWACWRALVWYSRRP